MKIAKNLTSIGTRVVCLCKHLIYHKADPKIGTKKARKKFQQSLVVDCNVETKKQNKTNMAIQVLTFHTEIFNHSSWVNPWSTRVTWQEELTWVDSVVNTYKHLTVEGLPFVVIQPGLDTPPRVV